MLNRGVQVLDFSSGRKLDLSLPEAFQSQMSEFLDSKSEAEEVVAGDIHLIGLDEVREKFGDTWDKVRKSLHPFIERVIVDHIEPEDIYYLCEDDQYIVLFSRLAPEEAGRKAKELAAAIGTALGVEDAPGGGMIATRCQVVPVAREALAADGGPDAITAAVEDAVAAAEGRELGAFSKSQDGLRPEYWPITNVGKKIISFYRTCMVSDDPDFRPPTGDAITAFDIHVLRCVTDDLAKRTGRNGRAFTLVPIHYETLEQRGSRNDYLEYAVSIEDKLRKRIALQIVNPPDVISQARLHRMFSEASPHFAGFALRLPVSFDQVKRLDGVKLIGVSVDGGFLGKKRPHKKQFKELKRFSEHMRERRLRTFMEGAMSVDAAIAARRAEFDYIDGSGVLQAMPLPGKVYKMG